MASDAHHLDLPPTCHANTRAIYDYWLEKRGKRRMPARRDLDPIEIPRALLPGICLVDVVADERRYVYRLVGTGEVELRGYDPTGDSVEEGFFGPSAGDALDCYDRVVLTGAPFVDATPFTSQNGQYVMLETIFLPLADDGIHVNKILAFSHSEGVRRFVAVAPPD
jgi:hypothetical protein